MIDHVGYPSFPDKREYVGAKGELQDWDGKVIGTCRVVALWKVQSFVGSYMHQIECVIGGKVYTGRGFGHGMLWKGRAKRSK